MKIKIIGEFETDNEQENYIIQKIPIAKWLAFNIIMWGVTLSLHAACHNFVGLVIVRGFLGAFEAVCQPSFVLLTSMWYKREEQATTAILWCVRMRHIGLSCTLTQEQVHDERSSTNHWRTSGFRLLLHLTLLADQVVASALHELWYHHCFLGPLCPVVDA